MPEAGLDEVQGHLAIVGTADAHHQVTRYYELLV